MPHVPDLNHDRHDLELVVAFASGDAAGTSDEAGAALVASCASASRPSRTRRWDTVSARCGSGSSPTRCA